MTPVLLQFFCGVSFIGFIAAAQGCEWFAEKLEKVEDKYDGRQVWSEAIHGMSGLFAALALAAVGVILLVSALAMIRGLFMSF